MAKRLEKGDIELVVTTAKIMGKIIIIRITKELDNYGIRWKGATMS